MNLSYSLARTRFLNGAAKVRIFLKPASVSEKKSKNLSEQIPMRQSCQELSALSATRFSNGSAKVLLFCLLPNYSRPFSRISLTITLQNELNKLYTSKITDCYIFVKKAN